MDRFVSQNAGGTVVRDLAARLLAHAAVSPELIRRSASLAEVQATSHEVQSAQFPTLALLSNPTLDVQPYLDDLVSLAVDAAERAEALSVQARQASRRARRESLVVGCFGALGLLFGITGFAARSSSDAKLAQVSNQVAVLQDQQRQAERQIAAFAIQATAPQGQQPVAANSVTPPPAFRPPSIRYHTQPWPDSSPNSRPVAATRNPQHTGPYFFSGVEREIHAIFR
jgi:hypothetical protein